MNTVERWHYNRMECAILDAETHYGVGVARQATPDGRTAWHLFTAGGWFQSVTPEDLRRIAGLMEYLDNVEG